MLCPAAQAAAERVVNLNFPDVKEAVRLRLDRLSSFRPVDTLEAMAAPAYRFAICNEIFQGVPFPEVCKQVQSLGYQGIELAPYHARRRRNPLRRA